MSLNLPDTDTRFAEFAAVRICDKSQTIEDALAAIESTIPEGMLCGDQLMRTLVTQFVNDNQKFQQA